MATRAESDSPTCVNFSDITREASPIEVVFQDLSYEVQVPKEFRRFPEERMRLLLKNLNGVFQPGKLTAIMGSSGAGKTTLLSVLAGSGVRGKITGEIRLNGVECASKKLRDVSGFVFQDDILLPNMKVKEAIDMSALLRLPDAVGKTERESRVNDTLDLLQIRHAEGTIVGSPLQKGISGGERKRTSIGMEMVINPSMLFLDEPTTGLDTFTAFSVIKSLSDLASSGRTVITTIHQPSTDIFELFDNLLLMSRGEIVYFGPAKESLAYFEQLGYICPTYSNPTDYYFMHVIREFGSLPQNVEDEESDSDGTDESLEQEALTQSIKKSEQEKCDERIEGLISAWKNSELHQKMLEYVEEPKVMGISSANLRQHPTVWRQFVFLFGRAGKNLIRNHGLTISRLVQAIFLGLIVGLTYLDSNQYTVNVQVISKSGALYFFAINSFFAAATQVLSLFAEEKYVFFREYQGGYYSLMPYYLSKTIVEIPGQIFGPFLMVLIAYYLIGLNPPFSCYLMDGLLTALNALCGNAAGTLISALIDDLSAAMAIAPVVFLPLILVSGIFVAEMYGFIQWIRYISPMYYSFSGMMSVEFSRTFPNCDEANEVCDGSRAFEILNYQPVFSSGVCVVFLVTIYVALWWCGFFALWFKSRQIVQ